MGSQLLFSLLLFLSFSTVLGQRFQGKARNQDSALSNGANQDDTDSQAPIQRLLPGVHWDVDTSSLHHLAAIPPSNPLPLYYGSGDPCAEGYFGHMTYYLNHSAVILDHSDHVEVAYDHPGALNLSYAHQEAFQTAVGSWDPAKGLILITSADGCGPNDDRCFFHVDSLQHDHNGLASVVTGTHRSPDELMHDGETEWGYWIPRHDSELCANRGAQKPSTKPRRSSFSSYEPRRPIKIRDDEPDSNNTQDLGTARTPCKAPEDQVNGLPTACVGPYFDQDLDDSLGYEDLLQNSDDMNFITGLSLSDEDQAATLARRFDLWGAIKGAVNDFGNFVDKAKEVVVAKIKSATTISKTLRKDLNFRLPDPKSKDKNAKTPKDKTVKQVKSPWGEALLLKSFKNQAKKNKQGLVSFLNIYCVDCGIRGDVVLQGKLSFNAIDGFKEGYAEINADMSAGVKIGVDAQIQYTKTFENDLLSVGLPGLSYGPVTIGPSVTLASKVVILAKAEGRILAGAELSIRKAVARLDVIDSSRSISKGWQPEFKPVFEATGSILLSASLGVPIKIGVGIKVFSFDKSLSLVNTPSIKAVAAVAASAKLDNGEITGGFKDINGCTGVSTALTWRYVLDVQLLDFTPYNLYDTKDRAIAQGCIKLPKSFAAKTTNDPPATIQDVTEKAHGSTIVDYPLREVTTNPYNFTSGLQMAPMVDPTLRLILTSCADGNVYVADIRSNFLGACTTLWAYRRQVVTHDGSDAFMHYYPDTMDKLGVSRVRTSYGQIPKGSVLFVLASGATQTSDADVPVHISTKDAGKTEADGTAKIPTDPRQAGTARYVAVDSAFNAFSLVVCTYSDGQAARLFLAKDLAKAITTLTSSDVMLTVTGGKVATCGGLPLVQNVFVPGINDYQGFTRDGIPDGLNF